VLQQARHSSHFPDHLAAPDGLMTSAQDPDGVKLALADTSGSARRSVPRMEKNTAIRWVGRSLVVEPGSLFGGALQRDRDDPNLPAPSSADCGCRSCPAADRSRRGALCLIPPRSEQSRTKHGSSMNRMTEPGGPESKASRSAGQAAFTSILVVFFASSLFGKATVRTPFLKRASILSASTPSGRRKERWNEP